MTARKVPTRPKPLTTPRKRASVAVGAVAPYLGPSVHLTITGIPRSGKNSQRQVQNRRTGARFTIKSKAASNWLVEAHAQLLRQYHGLAVRGACLVSLDIYHAMPLTSWDGDNVVSLAFDALKHARVLDDDKAAIARQSAFMTFVDKGHPRVEITISACTRTLLSHPEAA